MATKKCWKLLSSFHCQTAVHTSMKYVKTWLPPLLALAVLVGAVYGAWWLLAHLLAWVMVQPSQIAAAIIAFGGTVIAGIGAVVISQQRAKARDIRESHRPQKTKLYTDFITQVVGIMREHRGGKTLDEAATKKLEDFFFDFTTRVMLWGSPRVLQHYGAFRKVGEKPDPNIILLLDDILQAMRRDLGLSNRALARGDLIKMLLTDPESLDALVKK
ncbi:MAG: hypothetical protein ACYSUV_12305 [Planctomycetota bacterium]